MTINRTTLLDFPLPVTGTESGTWGDTTNNGLTQYLDIAIAGALSITGNVTLATTEGDALSTGIVSTTAQYRTLIVPASGPSANIVITAPSSNRTYHVINRNATYTVQVRAGANSGVTLGVNQSATVGYDSVAGDYVLVGPIGPTVPVSSGGTGAATLTANNVLLGNGTSAVQFVAPGSSGNVLTSNGTTWTSTAGASFATPLTVIGNSSGGAEIRLPEDTDNGSEYVAWKAPSALGTSLIFTMPFVDGASGQTWTTNGSGVLSFGTLGVVGGGTGQSSYTDGQLLIGNTTGNTLTKATLTGTSNQITVTNGSGSITLSTPQSIGTSSSVQFGSLGVGTAASGTTGEIRATNNVTAYYSDDRLKTKLGSIQGALDKVRSLNAFYYHANETAQALGYEPIKEVGLSAQQVQAVLPEVVAPAPIDEQYLTVRYERLVPLLIAAIQELEQEVKRLKGGV